MSLLGNLKLHFYHMGSFVTVKIVISKIIISHITVSFTSITIVIVLINLSKSYKVNFNFL